MRPPGARIIGLASDRVRRAAAPGTDVVRHAVADGVGTAFLLAVVVGSGIMGERLSHGDAGFTLLVNSLATGAGLVALILAFGGVSGAHLNPLVTLAEAARGAFPWSHVPPYVLAQTAGALVGVAAAHAMFGHRLFSISSRGRAGVAQMLSELVATFGLLVVIRGSGRAGLTAVALSVGSYIAAAYWFTSSTSFANPAVTLARTLTDSFVGVSPADAPGLLLGQAAGGVAAIAFLGWFHAAKLHDAPERHDGEGGTLP